LKEVGPKKINVIKKVRELIGLGLKEAKNLVEGAPQTALEGVTREVAKALKPHWKKAQMWTDCRCI
jgi:large subunit ribosomal protein L7/L12